MFCSDERRMIISTPFHLLERIAALESAAPAEDDDDDDDEAEEVVAAVTGVPVLTRLFCARVFIVSRGYVYISGKAVRTRTAIWQ